ncbi:small integral membrane protein 30-like [Corythoichthys intestinalis]|uniref:small integral membrane protein 30-like n=1 Tax=Corythoichthys intestinalis TaxID=161448 RepID=UPI0025A51511|nr:small integral membrane protein 30-like [Corythoichthys intestinalis]
MTPKRQIPRVSLVLGCLTFLQTVPPASAYDAGDAVALLLGTVIAMVGFCACLGLYARKRNRLL